MTTIITTVGTSLFTNYQADAVRYRLGQDYASIDDSLKQTQEAIAKDLYNPHLGPYVRNIEEKIEDYWFVDNRRPNLAASAEIASVLKIAEAEPKEVFKVHLIATDTLQSVLAAELIALWFEEYRPPNIIEVLFQRQPRNFSKQESSSYVIKDLRTDNQDAYEQGLMNLIAVLDTVKHSNDSSDECVINITGGYKGIVPFVALYALVENIEMRYLYDDRGQSVDSTELIRIGSLPISFDWSLGEIYTDYLKPDRLREFKEGDDMLAKLRSMRLVEDKRLALTPVGAMFKKRMEPLSSAKGGIVGQFIELKLFKLLSESGRFQKVSGKMFWWDQVDLSCYYKESQYNREKEKEKRLEIDLVLTVPNGEEEWVEVKSWSDKGLTKAAQQAKEWIRFWRHTSEPSPQYFHLLLYKLENQPNDMYWSKIEAIAKIFKGHCLFKVTYINLPVSRKGILNTKKLFELEDLMMNPLMLEP